MDCITCTLEINNENYIICLCGNKYHYKCLYKETIMKTNCHHNKSLINHHQNMLFSYLDPKILHLNVIHVYIIIMIIHQ